MRRATAFLMMFVLVSCGGQNDGICETPPEAKWATTKDSCIHRAAYKYARSAATNSELAKAVRTECDEKILEFAKGMTDLKRKVLDRKGTAYTQEDYDEGLDQAYQYVEKEAEAEALRRIVQAKAGNCDLPE